MLCVCSCLEVGLHGLRALGSRSLPPLEYLDPLAEEFDLVLQSCELGAVRPLELGAARPSLGRVGCAMDVNVESFRVHLTPRSPLRRGAAGSAATTVLAQGRPRRARRTCRRLQAALRAVARRDLATHGGSRNPRRGHPQCRACPQERALPRYKPRRGPQSLDCVAVVVRCSVGACLRWAQLVPGRVPCPG